jgi:hypothetical protein
VTVRLLKKNFKSCYVEQARSRDRREILNNNFKLVIKSFPSIFLEVDCTGANCAKHVPCFSCQALYNLMHNLGFCLRTHNVRLIKTNGQTDRQADRQTGRQADRQTGRQTDR